MAHPDYFNDPFWIPPVDSDIAVTGGEQLYVGIEMKMGGLGTIAAKTAQPKTSLKFIIRPQDKTKQPTLKLEITKNTCNLYKVDPTSGTEEIKCEFPKGKKSAYLNVATKDETVYWISVDRSNGRFRYGQHLTNASMTYLQFVFKEKGWMNNLKTTDVYKDDKELPEAKLKYHILPVTVDLPPVVVSEQQISLEELENYTRTTFANLPEGCQNLYHNIAGHSITVASASFPQLPEAIDQSCGDPNKVCGKMLEHKKGEFGGILETYLRITVGDNLANSPGIPYVMEIWPPGHFSPVHDHGKASAVIKVLYGSIDCTWFDALQEDRTPIPLGQTTRLSKGDVTWLGEKQYQIHQLKNNCKTVCITLQCYQFESHDMDHYEYFNWMDKNQKKHAFSPNSDMAYGRFVAAVKKEWDG